MLGVGEVIDRHHLEVGGMLCQDAEDETPDSTKTIDANTDCHDWTPGSLGEHTSNVKRIRGPFRVHDRRRWPDGVVPLPSGHRSTRIEAWIVAIARGLP